MVTSEKFQPTHHKYHYDSPFFMCQCCPHIENSELICIDNKLTGFYVRATLALNGLKAFKYFRKKALS